MKKANYAAVWSDESLVIVFEEVLEAAENDDEVLCLEDAIRKTNIPYSTYYQHAKNQPHLERLKDDAMRAIKRKINKGTLKEGMPPAPAIWRMKQCGEKDTSEVNQNIKGSIEGGVKHVVQFKNCKNEGE